MKFLIQISVHVALFAYYSLQVQGETILYNCPTDFNQWTCSGPLNCYCESSGQIANIKCSGYLDLFDSRSGGLICAKTKLSECANTCGNQAEHCSCNEGKECVTAIRRERCETRGANAGKPEYWIQAGTSCPTDFDKCHRCNSSNSKISCYCNSKNDYIKMHCDDSGYLNLFDSQNGEPFCPNTFGKDYCGKLKEEVATSQSGYNFNNKPTVSSSKPTFSATPSSTSKSATATGFTTETSTVATTVQDHSITKNTSRKEEDEVDSSKYYAFILLLIPLIAIILFAWKKISKSRSDNHAGNNEKLQENVEDVEMEENDIYGTLPAFEKPENDNFAEENDIYGVVTGARTAIENHDEENDMYGTFA